MKKVELITEMASKTQSVSANKIKITTRQTNYFQGSFQSWEMKGGNQRGNALLLE